MKILNTVFPLFFSKINLLNLSIKPQNNDYNAKVNHCNDPKFSNRQAWQTVQTQIRLLLEEQFDQGLHCLQFSADLLDKFLYGTTSSFEF